jgi:hypothetical protein
VIHKSALVGLKVFENFNSQSRVLLQVVVFKPNEQHNLGFMRNFTQITKYLGLLMVVLLMGACQEEFEIVGNEEDETLGANSTTANLIINIINTAAKDGSFDNIVDGASCFAVNFPYTVEVNGLEITIDSLEDLELIEEIFDSIEFDDDILEIIFPITITLADYSEIVVENAEQLRELAADCIEGGDDDDIECIDFVYPLTFFTFDVDDQQTGTVVVNSDEQLRQFLDNREDDELISLQYPVSLIKADGTTITVDSNAQLAMALEAAREECDEDDDDDYNDDDFTKEDLDAYLVECPWEIRDMRRDGSEQTEQYREWLMDFREDGRVKLISAAGGIQEGIWETSQTENGVLLTLDFNSANDFNLNWLVYELDYERIKFFSGNDNRIILKQRCDLGEVPTEPETLREILKECDWIIKRVFLDGEQIDRLLGWEFQFYPDGLVKLTNGIGISEGSWEIGENNAGILSLMINIGQEPGVNFEWPLRDLDEERLKFGIPETGYELILLRDCVDDPDGDALEISNILLGGGWQVANFEINNDDITESFAGMDFNFSNMRQLEISINDDPQAFGLWRVFRNADGHLKIILNLSEQGSSFEQMTHSWHIDTAYLTSDRISLVYEVENVTKILVFEKGI